MQDFEIPRYERALVELEKAFYAGLTQGKQQLADDTAQALPDIDGVFHIEVPRHDVLDDEWGGYTAVFKEHGRRAALATRRSVDEPKLFRPDPNDQHTFMMNEYRWTVNLGVERSM